MRDSKRPFIPANDNSEIKLQKESRFGRQQAIFPSISTEIIEQLSSYQ